jgi:tight adherence protein B
MLQALVMFVVVAIVSYFLLMLLFPQMFRGGKTEHAQNALQRMIDNTQAVEAELDPEYSVFRESLAQTPLLGMVGGLPFIGQRAAELIMQAGRVKETGLLLAVYVGMFLFLLVSMTGGEFVNHFFGSFLGMIMSLVIPIFLPMFLIYSYLQSRIRKRNDIFINMFPDVLDMIVRSVRSGFPLHTALKLVAENMEKPVSSEFRQVSDEIALGRPMGQALARLAERIPEPDIRFFVVVLNVQQETGGNLAEVISNLSGIIRKRKHLRMKIKAMTSEARATGWVLGCLPVVIFAALTVSACSSYNADLEAHLEAERDFHSHQMYLEGLYSKYDPEYIDDCLYYEELVCEFE